MTFTGTGNYSIGDPFFAGQTADGTLEITSGSYAAASGAVGGDAGVTGTMTLTGAATDVTIGGGTIDGEFFVGREGTGTLNIESGANFSSYSYSTYSDPDGIPQSGDEVFSGGYNSLNIGQEAGSNGTVNVTGTGSTLTVGGPGAEIVVGRAGDGDLNITAGGYVQTFFLETARGGTSNSTLSVDGAGSKLAINGVGSFVGQFTGEAGILRAGREAGSRGYISITNGAEIDVSNVDGSTDGPFVELARIDGSYGRLDIDGTGSVLNVEQVGAKGDDYSFGTLLRIGRQGQGIAEVTNGGAINVLGDGATLTVSDANFQSGVPDALVDPTSQLLIYSGSSVTVDAGPGPSAVYGGTHGRVYIGRNENGRGEVKVDGAGSSLTVSGYAGGIIAGRDGQGELTVSGGATVESTSIGTYYDPTPLEPQNGDQIFTGGYNNLVLGDNTSGVGEATITGAGSSFTVVGESGQIVVGRYGTGTLNIEAGGTVFSQFTQVGLRAGSNGTVNITGPGSTFNATNDYGTFFQNSSYAGAAPVFRIAREGTGYLNITDGGVLNVANTDGQTDGASFDASRVDGSVSTIVVDGTGSAINVTQNGASGDDYFGGALFRIGRQGQTSLTLSDNAQINVTGDFAEARIAPARIQSGNPDILVDPRTTVDITTGADFTVDSTGGNFARFSVAQEVNGRADITVDGAGSTLTVRGGYQRGDLGLNGEATLTISNGGYAVFDNQSAGQQNPNYGGYFTGGYGNLVLGRGATGEGSVTVTGAGSQLVTDGLSNRLTVGQDGNGTLNVYNGGRVDTLSLDVGRSGGPNGAQGTVNIDDATVYVGALGDTFGYTPYIGAGGTARFGRNENTGSGQLNIYNGGALIVTNVDGVTDSASFRLAQQDGSYGLANVSGAGSRVVVQQLGDGGDDYDVATAPAPRLGFAAAEIGRNGVGIANFTNDAELSITGESATLYVARAFNSYFAPENSVDPTSQLNILSGADAVVDSGTYAGAYVSIANGTNGVGELNVTGVGSTLTLDGLDSRIAVGTDGSGRLTINDGGVVNNNGTTANTYAGRNAGSFGQIDIDGTGSTLNAGSNIFLGDSAGPNGGAGRLIVTNGGTATAGLVTVGANSRLAGDAGTVDANVLITNGGDISPGIDNYGPSTAATFAIDGNLTIDNGNLLLDVEGTSASQHDRINVTGSANLSNTAFSLLFGSGVAAGTSVTAIAATGGLTFDANNTSLIASPSQAFSIADTGNDLVITALNNGSGNAILDFGAGSGTGATAQVVDAGGTGRGSGGNVDSVLFGGVTEIRGTNQVDTLTALGSAGIVLDGRGGSDTLTGGDGDDVITGGNGNDTIDAGDGDDLVNADNADVSVNGGDGTDTINFASFTGDVEIDLATGATNINATAINFENVTTGIGDDILTGTAGVNELIGGDGDDLIAGLAGGDVLDGGLGAGDTVDYSASVGGIRVNLFSNFSRFGDAEGDTISGFENVIGGSGVDIIRGDAGVNEISGNESNDRLEGREGNDTLNGGDGNDLLLGGTEDDTLNGGDGNDNLNGQGGDDILTGGEGTDRLTGAGGNDTLIAGGGVNNVLDGGGGIDTLIGGAARDILRGLAGPDILDGGGGNDSLTGGFGPDTFIFDAGDGNDIINDFVGDFDTIDLSSLGITFDDLTISDVGVGGVDALINYGSGLIRLRDFDAVNLDAGDFDFV